LARSRSRGTEELRRHPVTALAYGTGPALIIDEFALLLDLKDVYWAKQGRISVDVAVAASSLAATYFAALPVLRKTSRRLHGISGPRTRRRRARCTEGKASRRPVTGPAARRASQPRPGTGQTGHYPPPEKDSGSFVTLLATNDPLSPGTWSCRAPAAPGMPTVPRTALPDVTHETVRRRRKII
jgi:hypothetical protein